jgi:hypothetical protein
MLFVELIKDTDIWDGEETTGNPATAREMETPSCDAVLP